MTAIDDAALAVWAKRHDMLVRDLQPVNAEPPARVLAEADITAADAFYCRNHGPIPDIAASQWRLEIDGIDGGVLQPRTLTYDDLTTGFGAHDLVATLACAGNRRAELLRIRPIPGKEPWGQGAISTATWRGARLGDVLRAAGIGGDHDGLHVAITAPDVSPKAVPPQPFGSSIPLDKAMSPEVLLAWQMNGEPLPRIHGGPVRVLVPGFIGARSVKWVTGITVQPFPSRNYFQAVDYRLADVPLSSLPLNCGILAPDDGATVPVGPLELRGYAIADDCSRIARVEVSVDGGADWRQAELRPALSRWAWRPWSLEVTVAPGPLTVLARAWDDTGTTHPESAAALWNPGGYANNAWARIKLAAY